MYFINEKLILPTILCCTLRLHFFLLPGSALPVLSLRVLWTHPFFIMSDNIINGVLCRVLSPAELFPLFPVFIITQLTCPYKKGLGFT